LIAKSPESSETTASLGQDLVRRKITADSKCLRHANNFKYTDFAISCKSEKDIEQQLAKSAQTLAIRNKNCKQICPNYGNSKQEL
jgi:hypothetical protein